MAEPGRAPDDAEQPGRDDLEVASLEPPEIGDQEDAEALMSANERERQRMMEEMEASGEPMDYAEAFKKSPKFQLVAAVLEEGMKRNITGGHFEFENWPTTEPQALVASFFEENIFPRGVPGRDAFLDGLKLGPPKPEDPGENAKIQREKFGKSHAALQEIVKTLREHFKVRTTAEADIDALQKQHPLGDTIGDGLRTFGKNWQRSSGTEKLMMVGAVGIALAVLYKYKDSKVVKDITLQDLAMGAGAFLGVNYLFGKMSKDGRTPVQRMDLFRGVSELKDDNVLKAFAEEHGMGKDEEKLRAFVRLQHMDVKKLFELYEEASVSTNSVKEIDPKKLGLMNNEIDPKAAYEIMEALVKATAVNEFLILQKKECDAKGMPFEEPKDAVRAAEKGNFLDPGTAKKLFKKKYITGELANTEQTLFSAVINEYHTRNWQAIIARGKAETLPHRAYETGKKGVEGAYTLAKPYALATGRFISGTAQDAYEFGRDRIAKPFGAWAVAKFNKYRPYVENPVREKLAVLQERDLALVLPADFEFKITRANISEGSQAMILGLPGIPCDFRTNRDGKDVAIIKEIEFALEQGIAGNAPQAARLKNEIGTKVAELVTSKNISQLAGKTPAWDATEKKWKIAGVAVAGDTLLNLPAGTSDVALEIQPDGTTVKFFEGKQEITDFNMLAEFHRHAAVEKAIRDEARRAGIEKYFGNLQVVVDEPIRSDATHGAKIEGSIGDLEFTAVMRGSPRSVTQGLQFLDASGATVDIEKLLVQQTNGGEKFLDRLGAQVLSDGNFQSRFFKLEHLMENTSEGAWNRLADAFKTTHFWIIPGNIDGAINGKVLQRQWAYMLDYKRAEMIDGFKWEMQDQPLEKLPNVYTQTISDKLLALETLARDIESESDEQKAEKFPLFLERLETANYSNGDYIALFREFQGIIKDPRFKYEGVESFSDVAIGKYGAADSALEIYQRLLRVWHYHTADYSRLDPTPGNRSPQMTIDAHAKDGIRVLVTEKIREKLEAMQASDGKITLDELPAAENERDMQAWVDPSWTPGTTKRFWSVL